MLEALVRLLVPRELTALRVTAVGIPRSRRNPTRARGLTGGMAGLCFAFLAALSSGHGVPADELNDLRNSVAPVGDVDGDGVPDFALALRLMLASPTPTRSGSPAGISGKSSSSPARAASVSAS